MVATDSDECEYTAGLCALLVARRDDATEEDQLVADALTAFSMLDDVRKAAQREKAMVGL